MSINKEMGNPIDKTSNTRSYTLESYAIFHNVDKSIIGLNEIIEKNGYKFICISLAEFEKNFSNLFNIPKDFKSETYVKLGETDLIVTMEFWESLRDNPVFAHTTLFDYEVILLQRIKEFEQKVINNEVDLSNTSEIFGEQQRFVANLLQQLKLFKNGDIECAIQFQIDKYTRHRGMKSTNQNIKSYNINSAFSLTEHEIKAFSAFYRENFVANSLTALAIENFNLSYRLTDVKTKYITLMTCLECLFNQGKDQITHTVSRHLSLITSHSAEEFNENYYRAKKLYEIRSIIVHGDKTKVDLMTSTNELQNKVRQAINYCQNLDITKKELFNKLNALGFSE